jgi:putative hydrolase of the HAD superfamily
VLFRQDWHVYDEFGREHGLPDGALRDALYRTPEWRALNIGQGDRESWAMAAVRELGRHLDGRAEEVFETWRARPVERHEPNIDLARRLREAGARIGLLSNAPPDLDELITEHYGVHIEFHSRVISGVVGLAKPDPAIYHLAAERVGLPPGQCFFVDDLPANIEAARKTGMQAYNFVGDDYGGLQQALRSAGFRWD